jgi:hypothetical protein
VLDLAADMVATYMLGAIGANLWRRHRQVEKAMNNKSKFALILAIAALSIAPPGSSPSAFASDLHGRVHAGARHSIHVGHHHRTPAIRPPLYDFARPPRPRDTNSDFPAIKMDREDFF